jgi:hypothetical protein
MLLGNLLSLADQRTQAEKTVTKACRMAGELIRAGQQAPDACYKLSKIGWGMVLHRLCTGEGSDRLAVDGPDKPIHSAAMESLGS